MAEKYQGWTNYETWCINLWLSNEQSTAEYWTERATNTLEENDGNAKDARWELSKEIKDDIENGNPITDASLYSDLLTMAIGRANFYEIAENYIEIALEQFDKAIVSE